MAKRAERDYSPGWRLFTKIVLPLPIRGMMKLETRGKENFPRSGGMIVAGNHLSYADWPAMALFTYTAGHYPVFTIKSPVFDVKIIGPLLRKFGQLPVHRGRADAALVLNEAEQRVSRGACVIFYPEGTASRDPDHWPMVARTGVARLALTSGVPVIPVACWGAQVILPYGDKRPRLFPRKTVRIAAGPPVDLSAFRDKPLTASTLREATNAIMADVTRLLGGLRGEQPPAAPFDPRTARAAAVEPQAGDPEAGDPRALEPGAAEPGAAEPGAAEPGALEPGASEPVALEPGAADPGAAEPGAAEPVAGLPDAGGPDTARKAQQG
jgi:1-acyl-sn-glycerol-3-phosphate acyltransferase